MGLGSSQNWEKLYAKAESQSLKSIMTTLKIPFTLEQEARYRQHFRDVLKRRHHQESSFLHKTGVLVNMAVFELVKLGNNPDHGCDFFENDNAEFYDDIDYYCTDFSFFSIHALDWLMGDGWESRRLIIEEREEKITGEVSNSFDVIPLVKKKSKVLNRKGLDPARELTTKEAIEFFEEEMEIYADAYHLGQSEFEQLAVLEVLKSREERREMMKNKKIKEEKSPRGFGRSSR